MSRIRVACNHGTVRTDNVRRAISPASDWLSFVKFHHVAVIDVCPEGPLSGFYVSRECIR